MGVTTDMSEFCTTYHKNNNTINPLEGREIVVQKRKTDTIYYNRDTDRFTYTKDLCLGMLPVEIAEDIARVIHQFKLQSIFEVRRDLSKVEYIPDKEKYVYKPSYQFPIILDSDDDSCYRCVCYTKAGHKCKNYADNFSQMSLTDAPPIKYANFRRKYTRGLNMGQDNTIELCRVHHKMILRQLKITEADLLRNPRCRNIDKDDIIYKTLGWEYAKSNGIPIKIK
jgi:hypothetical protein